ncbi:phosphoribosyltransferase-like protein [Variovorax ureilyticus]|uniref:phosphoribosyltransferase-like protein n=1 Tax=Variovorax ureilyticus TaxID=1836198 RepID=UPI003D675937
MSSLSLQFLQEVAEALAAQYLGQYTASLNAGAASRLQRKEINDALWGTVLLSPAEVAVLDSPLLQRLRFLRQMGVAHWVYPGAVHTRFEHAIGALHQTKQLIDSLNAQARSGDEKPLISEEDAHLLRLSSLFSHVGYLAFSDSVVLELGSQSELATAVKDFAAEGGPTEFGADPSFCQLLAHYIVRSPAVKEFLLTLVKKGVLRLGGGNDEDAAEHAVDKISLTVIGRRIDESRPQLQGLVNGPFDASTLDALVRDAKFSGIPSVLDIRRLIQKLAVKSFRLEALPDWINESLVFAEEQQEQLPPIWIFGVPASSAPILNELQLAQVLVTTKIRRHPKVLATEQMLRSVVRTLSDLASAKDLLILLYSTGEDVLVSMSAVSLEASLSRNPDSPLNEDSRARLNLAAGTLAAIRERRIWVRALQFSNSVIEADSSESVGITRFYDELRHVQRGPELLAAICDEVASVLRVTGQSTVSRGELAAQINLLSLQSISAEPRIGRAIVLPPAKHPYMLRESWEGADNWVDQYLRGQPTVYVFSTPELADSVYVAIERLADRLFDAKLPSGTIEASKREGKQIRTLKQRTAVAGFWHGQAWSIRPRASVWSLGTIDKRIRDAAFKLNRVDTISVQGREPNLRDGIYRWLEQFETTNDIDCALTMLERFELVDRKKTTAAFNALFQAYPEFHDAYAVSFGDPKDGGVIQGYFAADHPQVVKVVTLDQWAREPDDRPLIFVDDCCGSGSQVCDVLAAWLERADLREDLDEKRDPQPRAVQERLLKTKIAFLFITAWDAGVDKIREQLTKLNLDAIVFPYLPEADIPFVEKALKAENPRQLNVDAFVERCNNIGREILESNKVAPEKVEKRKFGYGNKGMLLATLVNVPTQTTTLIWESGVVDGTRWEALLPRRKKT